MTASYTAYLRTFHVYCGYRYVIMYHTYMPKHAEYLTCSLTPSDSLKIILALGRGRLLSIRWQVGIFIRPGALQSRYRSLPSVNTRSSAKED
jgi:hypothetical protein